MLPIQSLTLAQRNWYARMVVAAILADGQISQPETEFIKQIAGFVSDPIEKQELLKCIATKSSPAITKPSGMLPEMLAATFIELSLILISDLEFTATEQKFLNDLGVLYGFTKNYYQQLLSWVEEGLAWKHGQYLLVALSGDKNGLQVPLVELNQKQRMWYAQTLISTIMLDGQLEVGEVSFLKMAVSFVDNPQLKNRLINYISNRDRPPLEKPPQVSKSILIRIFIEVMLIVSADETLEYREIVHLQRLSELCGFSKELYERLIGWCQQGIQWKQSKNPLIAHCQIRQDLAAKGYVTFAREKQESPKLMVFSHDDATSGSQQLSTEYTQFREERAVEQEVAPEKKEIPINNSVIQTKLKCFVCSSTQEFNLFLLKSHSQQVKTNIFGIPTYLRQNPGYDYIDYNHCKVTICPTCFFASTQKGLFRKDEKVPTPTSLNHVDLYNHWLERLEKSKAPFGNRVGEISSHRRSLAVIIKSYQMAIKSSDLLAEFNHSVEQTWHSVMLKLTMAEVLMKQKKRKQAEQVLRQIRIQARELFETVSSNQISFRSGRLLFLTALYFKESRTAKDFYEFFCEIRKKRFEGLTQEEQKLFKRIFGEIKRALENREHYSREYLQGFHLK